MPSHAIDSGDIWTERAGSGAAAVARRGFLVQVGTGAYEFRASGIQAGSLVGSPASGYTPVVGDFSGAGVIAFVGNSAVVY
jgi:hypothetical protein